MVLFDGILSWVIAIIIVFGLVVLAVMSFIYFVIITFFPYSIYPYDGHCLVEQGHAKHDHVLIRTESLF